LRDTDGDHVFDPDDICVNEPAGDHPDPARRGCSLADTDHDLVFEPDDLCPTTAQGDHPDPERRGCPDVDDDNDSVLNHADQCRTVHQGWHPDAARPGCPLPDRDNDSIPDATDACPDVPGAPSLNPRRNGCPGLVLISEGQIRILRPVFFATNRDVILPRSRSVLTAIVEALRASPDIRRLSIDGFTDDVGDDAANLELSRRRAANVMAWLVTAGIDATRLESHGYGETRPLMVGTTAPVRAANRRVELHIVDPAPLPHDAEAGLHAPAPAPAPAASSRHHRTPHAPRPHTGATPPHRH
jgi:outer membrane protein OmpA-like peptidoglycan-associated protein